MDPALLLGSGVAILVLALMARALYPSVATLDEASVCNAFALAYPELEIERVLLARGNHAAFVVLRNGVAVARAMHGDVACRHITQPGLITRQESALHIPAPDMTFPAVTFVPQSDIDHEDIARHLAGLRTSVKTENHAD